MQISILTSLPTRHERQTLEMRKKKEKQPSSTVAEITLVTSKH